MFRYYLLLVFFIIFLSLIHVVERLLLSDDLAICVRLTEVLLICE